MRHRLIMLAPNARRDAVNSALAPLYGPDIFSIRYRGPGNAVFWACDGNFSPDMLAAFRAQAGVIEHDIGRLGVPGRLGQMPGRGFTVDP